MLIPETYQAALVLMLVSMLCWGSWANTLKLCPGYRFQLFYWDYAMGVLLGAVVLGLTAGSHGASGNPFFTDIVESPLASMKMAALGGVVFNIANLLLVAAIDVAGLAVAFPVGIGLALIVGSVWSYIVSPKGNPTAAVWRSGAGHRSDCSGRGSVSQARDEGEGDNDPRDRVESDCGIVNGKLLSARGARDAGRARQPGTRTLCDCLVLCGGCHAFDLSGKLAADVEAAGWKAACAQR